MTLLTDIDKKPFQRYTIEHGIERIHVKVPLLRAKEFEQAIAEAIANDAASKAQLIGILERCDGTIRGK